MRVKYKGGPMNGQTQEFSDRGYHDQIRVDAPVEITYANRQLDAYAPIQRKTGFYQKSRVTQKNGAHIYVWLGWEDGTF